MSDVMEALDFLADCCREFTCDDCMNASASCTWRDKYDTVAAALVECSKCAALVEAVGAPGAGVLDAARAGNALMLTPERVQAIAAALSALDDATGGADHD